MFSKVNKNVLIVSLIAVVGALGYGIVFPILYSYTQRFGLSDFGNGLLFASFSLAQFLATPLIGRLSDKYGRKPLLTISVTGTFVSFLLMAYAPNIVVLFIARILDGLTAGNLPVAQAVISDSTKGNERTRGFGFIGASFGFGFIFGPAISAFTLGISDIAPFLFAAGITLIAVILTVLYLPETNKHIGEVKHGKLIDLGKLWHSLFDKNVGTTFLISLFFSLAFSLFIYAFQPYSVKVLNLSPNQISLIFTIIGIFGLITQMVLVQKTTQKFGINKTFTNSFLAVSLSFLLPFLFQSFLIFIAAMILLSIANGLLQPLINKILSEETDDKSQGSIMGLNVSYASIGQIVGPILGGAIATLGVSYPFLAGCLVVLFCYYLSFIAIKKDKHKESMF